MVSKSKIVSILILIIIFTMSAYFYSSMPEKMATHWDAKGNVNGYMPAFSGIFTTPFIGVFLLIMFFILPKMDPTKQDTTKYFDLFSIVLMIFLFCINLFVILYNLGIQINISNVIMPLIGLLFFFIGYIIRDIKKNWFIGIRTPWTLSSNKVWKKTHRLASLVFRSLGLFVIVATILKVDFLLIMILLIGSAFITVVYSYIEFKKEKH